MWTRATSYSSWLDDQTLILLALGWRCKSWTRNLGNHDTSSPPASQELSCPCLHPFFWQFRFDSNQLVSVRKSDIVARWWVAYIASSVFLLLGRLSGPDINAARHLNSLTKVALQSWVCHFISVELKKEAVERMQQVKHCQQGWLTLKFRTFRYRGSSKNTVVPLP